MIKFLLFVLFSAQAAKNDEKEETCFVLGTRAVVNREKEWKEILVARPKVTEQALRNKLVEESFNFCMKTIKNEDIKKFGGTRVRDYNSYKHLVDISYEKYKGNIVINPDPLFETRKIDIAKRVAIKSMERGGL
jgi:hypothetical protein